MTTTSVSKKQDNSVIFYKEQNQLLDVDVLHFLNAIDDIYSSLACLLFKGFKFLKLFQS